MKKSRLLIIAGLNLLLILVAIWQKPRFQTNDDIGMIYGYSGTSIFSEPTPVNAFSTKIWGTLMVFLYNVLPAGIEVYTVIFFILIFIANVIIHSKLFESLPMKGILFWIFLLPILAFINLYFYLELQFTMVSGLLCFAGVLLLTRKPDITDSVLGSLLFVLASLIRPSLIPIIMAFLFILCISATFIMPLYIDTRKAIFKRFGMLTLAFCAIYLMDKGLHTEKEKRFLDFNLYRAGIVDYNIEHSKSDPLQPEWGKEELFLFKNWFYNDTILYSQARNYKAIRSSQNGGLAEKADVKQLRFSSILQQLLNPYFRCILILSIIPLLLIRNWRGGTLFLLIVLTSYILIYNLLTLFLKEPPFRLSFMMLASGIFLHLFFTLKSEQGHSGKLFRFTFAGTLLLYGFLITKISLVRRKMDIMATRCIENYDSSLMYIRWADYPFELVDPFMVSANGKGHKIISLGAFSVHPAVKNEFMGFKYGNLTGDIIGKDKIISFMMPMDTVKWKDFALNYVSFVQKHYNRQVYFERVENSTHCFGYSDYKLKEKADAKLD